jgi:hypothetical protein
VDTVESRAGDIDLGLIINGACCVNDDVLAGCFLSQFDRNKTSGMFKSRHYLGFVTKCPVQACLKSTKILFLKICVAWPHKTESSH